MDVNTLLSLANDFEKSVDTLRNPQLINAPESEPEIEVITPPTDAFSKGCANLGALLFKASDKAQYLARTFFSYDKVEITDYQMTQHLLELEKILLLVNKRYMQLLTS